MPFAEVDGLRVHYRLDGAAHGAVLVLAHSLGMDLSMWDAQASAWSERFRVLRYDSRGHGRTAVTPPPYAVPALAQDVLGLLDALHLERVHFCGLSMGGLVGMWLAAHVPQRIDRLILCSTAARIGTVERWNERMEAVRRGGLASVSSGAVERWFSASFRERWPDVVTQTRARFERTHADGYLGWCAAIRDADLGPDLPAIKAPTLVLTGSTDPATTPAEGRQLAGAIADARYVELPAAHLSNLEAGEALTAAVSGFLTAEAQG